MEKLISGRIAILFTQEGPKVFLQLIDGDASTPVTLDASSVEYADVVQSQIMHSDVNQIVIGVTSASIPLRIF
ncbi:hypothetical protein FGO68_gene13714 [Halteria grandinella]|uniref:Uncharacterized protein n=1 Tax=Halteria grandinella TaxID=5974 RepID=A0A8J8TA69_HALGN|nr:hypothetical protein FGO68_gene13714 [Halteria grandinella]